MSEERFSRNCPKCGVVIWYRAKKGLRNAESYNGTCPKCRPKKANAINKTERLALVIQLHSEGKNNVEIAKVIGVSPNHVSRMLKKEGLMSCYDFGGLRDEWLEKLRDRFELGRSNEEIADELKLPPKTVNKYRRRLGCKSKTFYLRRQKFEEIKAEFGEEIIALHNKGRKVGSIALKFNLPQKSVVEVIESNGLIPIYGHRADRMLPANEVVDESSIKCYKCGKVSPIGEFAVLTGRCKICRTTAKHELLNNDIELYFKTRLKDLQRRSIKKGVDCTIIAQELVDIYNEQDGKCFYTGEPLVARVGSCYTEVRQSISVDKIIPEYGYIKDNTVLCTFRANTIKQDMNIKEMHYWFSPRIYQKILNKVHNLIMERF